VTSFEGLSGAGINDSGKLKHSAFYSDTLMIPRILHSKIELNELRKRAPNVLRAILFMSLKDEFRNISSFCNRRM